MTMRRPTIYSIPPGEAFVDVLAAGILERFGDHPIGLAGVTILLPTRRATRALSEAFLRLNSGRAMLLPAMRPLGDVDDEELLFDPPEGADDLELPPAIPPLRRRLLLAELVRKHQAVEPAQAAALAAELARLIDQLHAEELTLEALRDLVPADYAAHWRLTLDFLQILGEPWRQLLAAEGAIDPAARRSRLVRLQAERWAAAPPKAPVIAAGSTGSMPATAALLSVVARLPCGMVVLPGLDQGLDDAAWAMLDPGHPQYGLKQLLDRLDVDRSEVEAWPTRTPRGRARPARQRLISEALRPAGTTEQWRALGGVTAEALAGLDRIDCAGPQEEAGVIALLMRRTLETPGATAALVTPDRRLARRVAAELTRWNIDIDDSAGTPLGATPPGTFLRLVADMALEALAPVPLLAALKHPLALGRRSPRAFKAEVRRLERRVLRGPRPAPGFGGLLRALEGEAGSERLLTFVHELRTTAEPLLEALSATEMPLSELLHIHVAVAEWLATDEAGDIRLWHGEAGEAMAAFVADLHAACEGLGGLAGAEYPALFSALLQDRVVRPRFGRHPRLHIWGLLEARLQQADLLILGALNEGTWPAEPAADPWLSRPMREALGLPAPERRIGLAAHDFAQASAASQAVLTRATKVDGAPTVPSRWLLRLDTVLKAAGLAWGRRMAADLLAWQRVIDVPAEIVPVAPPEPRPPIAVRPRQLSVTQVETWIRDPYAIYARCILKLTALEGIDADPGAAERGTAIHQALDAFMKAFPDALPQDSLDRLLDCGREAFGAMLERPGVRAFWWPRFERIAAWFVAWEQERRRTARPLASEVKGELWIDGPAGPFALTATADRIDGLGEGGVSIIDYKTGAAPSKAEIEFGLAPQLPLEAAIATEGGFAGIDAAPVRELAFWQLTGGREPGVVIAPKLDPAAVASDARAGLQALIAAFDDEDTPYRARPRPDIAPRFGDYDQLARVKEWSAETAGDVE